MKHLLVLLAPLMVASSALAAPVEVRRVIDGDTVVLTTGERVRLACMDTPERGVMGAAAATAELRRLVLGQTVQLRRITTDRYGRTIGELTTPAGINVGEALVNSGHARIYRRYAYQCGWSR